MPDILSIPGASTWLGWCLSGQVPCCAGALVVPGRAAAMLCPGRGWRLVVLEHGWDGSRLCRWLFFFDVLNGHFDDLKDVVIAQAVVILYAVSFDCYQFTHAQYGQLVGDCRDGHVGLAGNVTY